MMLLAEVPGGRRARVVMFVLIAICAISVRSFDRIVTQWFDGLHVPDPPTVVQKPPGGIQWDERSMWR